MNISLKETVMTIRNNILFIATLLFSLCANSAVELNKDPLFINLTSNESHRATMAIGFGNNQLLKGHPLVVFLNDKGVLLVSAKNRSKFTTQQQLIQDIIKSGGTVYACPSCMKYYAVNEADLIPGVKISNPDLTEAALFTGNVQTLSW